MARRARRDVTIDLGAMTAALSRARRPLLAVSCLAAATAILAAMPFATGHRAVATLAVAPAALAAAPQAMAAAVEAEGSRLTSPAFLARVVARPGFPLAAALRPAGLDPIESTEDLVFGPPTGERAVHRLAARLAVRPGTDPASLDVAWTGADRATALAVTDAIAAEWVADARGRGLGRPSEDPAAAIAAIRAELADLDARRAVVVESTAAARRGADDLDRRIEAEKAERTRLEAAVPMLAKLARGEADVTIAAELTDSPTLRQLRDRRAEVARRSRVLADTYLAEHPTMKAVRAEAADLDRQIRSEASRLERATRSDLAAARGRIERMEARADEVDTDPIVTGSIGTDAGSLDARAGDLRRRLGELLDRASNPATAAPFRLVPASPIDVGPLAWTVRGLGAGLAVWLIAGLVAGFRGFRLDRREVALAAAAPLASISLEPVAEAVDLSVAEMHLRLEAAFSDAAGAPSDAMPTEAVPAEAVPSADLAEPEAVPEAGATPEVEVDPALLPPIERRRVARPAPEPIHRIWDQVAAEGAAMHRIVVVGAEDAACGRRVALALLRAASIGGETACAVDLASAEVAPPPVGRAAGLSDLLAGTAGFGEAIVRDRASRGHLIGPGAERLAARALTHPGVEGMVEALERVYDRVILDAGRVDLAAAALVASADAVILAADTAMPEAEIARARIALVTAGAGLVLLAAADRPLEMDDAA